MPRGVYDRSKTKEQRAAEKAAGKPSNPKAPKRHAYGKKGAPGVGVLLTRAASGRAIEDSHQRMEVLENYFAILTNAKAQGAQNPRIEKAINLTIDRMESLADQIWPLETADVEDPGHTNKKNGAHATPQAAPAPVLPTSNFNPPTPPQS